MELTQVYETKFEVFDFKNKRFARSEDVNGVWFTWYEFDYFTESFNSTENETYLEVKGYEKTTLESEYQKWKVSS